MKGKANQSLSLKDFLNNVHKSVWRPSLTGLPWWKRTALRGLRILQAIICDLKEGQLSLMAMSLVYTTLISLVPLLALSFSVLKGFGVHNQIRPLLLNMFDALGEKRNEVVERIITFVDNTQVAVLGALGLALLVYSVVAMMQKIEAAFNYTWHVSKGRTLSKRISDYLSVLFVGPLLIFLSMSISTSMNLSSVNEYLNQFYVVGKIIEFLGILIPYLLMAVAFAFIYFFMPNTKVNFTSALIGGLITAIIWKFMGAFFAAFVANSKNNAVIYATFATLIVFLVWVYLAWLVLLIGASISFYHQKNPKSLLIRKDHLDLSCENKETLGLSIIFHIARNFAEGKILWTEHTLAAELGVPEKVVSQLLKTFEEEGLIVHVSRDTKRYLPARDIGKISVGEVLKIMRQDGDKKISFDQAPHIAQKISKIQNKIDVTVKQLNKITIKSLIS